MNKIEKYYPEMEFGGFTRHDGTVSYYTRLQSLLRPEMSVLEVGCGRGAGLTEDPVPIHRKLRQIKGKCRAVVGIDIDPDAASNPGLDEFRLIVGNEWPVDTDSFDLVHCDFVLEHVENPAAFVSELNRVLKEDGIFCARTTNLLSYAGVASKFIPNSQHSRLLKILQPLRSEEDVFSTYYRINTTSKIKRYLNKYKYFSVVYGNPGIPSYFMNSYVLFGLGVLVHAITPSCFRNSLAIWARKPKVK